MVKISQRMKEISKEQLVEIGKYEVVKKDEDGLMLIRSEYGECLVLSGGSANTFYATAEALWARDNLKMPLIIRRADKNMSDV